MPIEDAEFDEMSESLDDLVTDGLGIFARFRETTITYKAEYLKYLLPFEPKTILDYGCGPGLYTPYLKAYFPNAAIYGCDVSGKCIDFAREKHPDCEFSLINRVEDLEQYNEKIDCVFINCVLHHIPPAEHEKWITGLYNTMKKGAFLIVFEMNMYNPLSRASVHKSPIDKNATMLTPRYCKSMIEKCFIEKEYIKLRYSYFFPWRNSLFVGIEHTLGWLPLGAQYYVAVKK